MKCRNCSEEVSTICEALFCEVPTCQKLIEVAVIDDEETSYSVLCPQHQDILFLIREKINS
jgi:hypothetical protein